MPTKPHTDPENGYSLRIGKFLPPEAANLAYVHTDGPEPTKNLMIVDTALDIPENRERDAETVLDLYTQEVNLKDYVRLQSSPNLILNSNDFETNYNTQSGATITRIKNQTVSEWQTNQATYFKITGGTSHLRSIRPLVNNADISEILPYTFSIYIKNVGETKLVINTNSSASETIHPGVSKRVVLHPKKNGNSQMQIQFNSQSADIGKELEFYVYGLQLEHSKEPTEWLPHESESYSAMLVHKNGQVYKSENERIYLTSQYTTDVNHRPLYYISSVNDNVYLRNQLVYRYVSGKTAGEQIPFSGGQTPLSSFYEYKGNQIEVRRADGGGLHRNEHIKLIVSPSGQNGQAILYVMSSFSGEKAPGYQVTYPILDGQVAKMKTEVLNPFPLSYEGTQHMGLDTQQLAGFLINYKLHSSESGYYIEMIETQNQDVKRIDFETRPPHAFSYQITSHIETRFSQKNPYTVKIGLIYLNENIPNAIPLTSALKKMVQGNSTFPDYLNFENPHRESGENLKESTNYWLASLQMPKEHYLDYDILILSGYGQADLSPYAENFRTYLDGGGTLLVDNNGTANSVLDFKTDAGIQTFISDIAFSKTQNESGRLVYGPEAYFAERYYPKEANIANIGVVRPTLQFLNQENKNDWLGLIEHQSGGYALAQKKTGFIGKLLVSTLGLMNDVIFDKSETSRILTNLFLYLLENKTFKSPLLHNQVLHRDDLYEEDYQEINGQIRYIDDQSDQDDTQIVAKKQLASHVYDVANRYLPYAYQRPIQSSYEIDVSDSSYVSLTNSTFEASSSQTLWTDTSAITFSGFRYVVLSKGSRSDGGLSSIRKSGRQAAYVRLTNSRAYFEQEVLELPAGDYFYRAAVRTDSVTGGGISVYNANGELIKASTPLQGTSDWQTITLAFTLEQTQTVYLRLGSSEQVINGTLYFDDLELESEGMVRMTPNGNGQESLYAYAVRPKGKSFSLDQGFQESVFLRGEHTLHPSIRIRSFVYVWNPDVQQYQKQYGKENTIKTTVSRKDGEKVVGLLLNLIPGKEAGYQWRYDQNVFYEIALDSLEEMTPYLNLSIYDPSTQTYFYSPTGEWILNRDDLWWNGNDSTVQLRISSHADALYVTGKRYTLNYPNDELIQLLYPDTRDERDRWYPRIQKGAFTRQYVSSNDVKDLNLSGRDNYYQEYLSGIHQYGLPEYNRQSFYPIYGQRLVEDELAVYENKKLITVSHRPLIVKQRVLKTKLFNLSGDGKTFQSTDGFWDETYPIKVYLGSEEIIQDYEIDFYSGTITFKTALSAGIELTADVAQQNIKVTRRTLSHAKIKNERLTRVDDTSMKLSKDDIAVYPSPVFYRDGQIINSAEYWIDFNDGLLHFYQTNRKNIYADYAYYTKEVIPHTDINRYTGEIHLSKPIHFRDEILVDYVYEENTLVYKGYRDPETGVFQHLDLNPTAGHTYTSRIYDNQNRLLRHEEQSSEQLLNKEIYFYLLPIRSNYLTINLTEDNPMRHCFGESEWRQVKATHPQAMLIGRAQVRENTSVDNAIVLDARREGGGLKEHIKQSDIEKRVGFTSAFWDIGSFDGLAYYENGVSIIRLPERILQSNGGLFTETDIREKLGKYLAFGVYPIIEFIPEEVN